MEMSTVVVSNLPQTKPKPPITRTKVVNIIVTLVLSLGSIIMLFPLVWMLLSTFKPYTELNNTFLPKTWTLSAYKDMWDGCNLVTGTNAGLLRGFLSSILTTVPVVLVQVVVSAFAAFAFAKLHFVGKNVIFLLMLGTMMIPFAVIMLPQAKLFGMLGLINGPLAVIIPKFFGSITTVFFLRQFLYGIPDSISEAARIDGAGFTKTFLSIILPLLMPALATQAILSFIGNWNDYLGPLLFITDKAWLTLPLLVDGLNASGGSFMYVPRVFAASFVSLVPIIVIFATFQKKIVGSIVFSAVKG